MIEELLKQNEGKSLEFKEKTDSLPGIIRTVIAFANTAGGILVIGIRDTTKEIIGIDSPVKEELRLSNAIADSIAPIILPEIEIITYRSKELLLVRIPYSAGPCFLKSLGPEKGTYIRIGSTNRPADAHFLQALTLVSKNMSFDELPYMDGDETFIDWDLAKQVFGEKGKVLTKNYAAESLGIFIEKFNKFLPTNGGILLFAKNRLLCFPDSQVRCARFLGVTRSKIIDQVEINAPLYEVVDHIIQFIKRHTEMALEIKGIAHTKVHQFSFIAIREAVINAIVHADYSSLGTFISIAIFDDRIECINPGGLPLGLTIERALSGASKLRNRVIGRVFRELQIIEQWGSGLRRIIDECSKQGVKRPKFEDLSTEFKVTLYSTKAGNMILHAWEQKLLAHLRIKKEITTRQAAALMKVTERTARNRMKKLLDRGIIKRIGTSEKDPNAFFILALDPFEPDSIL